MLFAWPNNNSQSQHEIIQPAIFTSALLFTAVVVQHSPQTGIKGHISMKCMTVYTRVNTCRFDICIYLSVYNVLTICLLYRPL